MKTFFTCLSIIFLLGLSVVGEAKPIKILVYSKTNGFRHKTIPTAIAALKTLAMDNDWQLTFTEDSLMFSKYKLLKKYKAILFLYTTGKVLGNEEEIAFKKYIDNGGAWITIHTGTDCEQNWDWYVTTIGAKFKNHPKQQQAKFLIQESQHPSTTKLPKEWLHFDEIYNYDAPVSADVHILITVDESSYTGGTMGTLHPIAWYKNVNKGRVFQTALGHTDACYSDKDFINHLVGGIKWALK